MYYRYIPYPYYRRYYNINPYHYRRYYNPYYSIYGGQYANVDQSIINYGDMTEVIQDSDIYQSMSPKPEKEPESPNPEVVDVSPTTPPESNISIVVN
jgi:hypothetical protein